MIQVHFHFSIFGFSNCYVVGPEEGGPSIIIDPGQMSVPLLRTIEDNHYKPVSALITHSHPTYVQGLGTLLKIYPLEVFAASESASTGSTIVDGTPIRSAGIEIDPIVIGGHSFDSVVYRIGSALFTGDVLGAGTLGPAPNAYAGALMVETIRARLFALPGDYLVFPGHGPPSTLEAERRLNPAFL